MSYQIWAWFETFKGNVNRTNTVNLDAHWTSGAKNKGGFEISLATDRVVAKFLPLKGRTIRRVMGGGGGEDFQLAEIVFFFFFFVLTACAGIYFLGETLCTVFFFFFFRQILLFFLS